MILIDPRDGGNPQLRTSFRAKQFIERQGLPTTRIVLEAGDFAFDGLGPNGPCTIGIERKTLGDMLSCIDSGKFSEQAVKMRKHFAFRFLALEGVWRPHTDNRCLMEEAGNGWRYTQPRGHFVQYDKLFNYLISVSLAGIVVQFSRDLEHTCFNVVNTFRWFQKKWNQHKSMQELETLNVPGLLMSRDHEAPLVRRWAAEIDLIGITRSEEAEHYFKTPIRLANSDEVDWLHIQGIAGPSAQKIIRQIQGKENR